MSTRPAGDVTPAVASSPAVAVAVSPPALRPWDRASKSKPAKGRSRPAPPAAKDTPQPVTPAFSSSTVTRIDIAHPATMVGSADIGRRLRVGRLKQAGAAAVWLAIIVIIALILFVGSQPAAPDFDSYARLIA